MTTPPNPGATHADEEYVLPCAEALLAGTLALLTACAQGSPDCPNRPLMASKLVSNLIRLSHHPAFSPQMHTMLTRLCVRWQQEACGTSAPPHQQPQEPSPLWHRMPSVAQ